MIIAKTVTVGLMLLTPRERWAATRRLSTGFMSEDWFIMLGAGTLVVLAALLLWVSFREFRARRIASRTFAEGSVSRGLSSREQEILKAVADSLGLERADGIFNMEDVFERGAAKLIRSSQTEGGGEASRRLANELASLKEKLGFQLPAARPHGATKLSSRQIPVGKKVHLTRRSSRASDSIEATVVGNDDVELTVELGVHVKVNFGEMWRVRYYFGAAVWEFDTAASSYDGGMLVLNHSDDIRFVNRRRFVRVPVRNLAFISRFPFSRMPSLDARKRAGGGVVNEAGKGVWEDWQPIEFVHAVVTELAGPGLRIEAPLDAKAGERVLVIFKLDMDEDETLAEGRGATSRIVEDIAEVKRSEKIEGGYSIGIELVGLKDSDIGELIRATNTAAARASLRNMPEGESAQPQSEQAQSQEAVPVQRT